MRTLFRLLAVISLAAAILPAQAHEYTLGNLVIGHPWSRATPGGAKVGAGYLVVNNKGTTADKLVSATTAAAGRVEIHEMAMKDGVMTMRPLGGGLTIEPGKSITLAPGGFHLMLMELKAPFKQGDKVPLTLVFEKAGKIDVTLNVEAIGATPSGQPMGSHAH